MAWLWSVFIIKAYFCSDVYLTGDWFSPERRVIFVQEHHAKSLEHSETPAFSQFAFQNAGLVLAKQNVWRCYWCYWKSTEHDDENAGCFLLLTTANGSSLTQNKNPWDSHHLLWGQSTKLRSWSCPERGKLKDSCRLCILQTLAKTVCKRTPQQCFNWWPKNNGSRRIWPWRWQ